MRADRHIVLAALLVALLWVVLMPCAQAAAPAGQWWNLSYNYRRVINIPAGTTALPTSHPVSVVFNHSAEVGMSRSLATGNDVRVVRWNGSGWTELDRVADADSAWNTTTTRIWFRTAAQINANVTDDNYYIYYNYPAAGAPPATAENVFLMFDDFSASLSSSRWSASSGTPVGGGILQVNTNGSLTATSAYSFGVDTIWETRLQLTSTYGAFEYWGASATVIFFPVYLRFQADSNSHQVLANDLDFVAESVKTFTPVSPTSYHVYAFTREGSSVARFLIDGTQVQSFNGSEVPSSNLRASMSNDEGGQKMNYDWVRVRRYRNPDPSLSLAAAESRVSGVDHFTLVHDRQGINCVAETIVVNARDATNNPVTNYTQNVTLTTNTGKGTWSKVTGSGTFSDGTANDGVATYTWVTGESSATFTLSYPSGAPTFDIDVYQTSTPAIDDDDTEGTMTFSPSGFTVTSSQLSNPPPATITAFNTAQTAGTAFNVYLTAYGQTPTDSVCGVIEDYAGAKTLSIGTGYVNPGSGSVQATLVASSVTFTNGQGVAAVKYKDVGNVIISIADGGIVGSTGNVVVRPANFTLSNIRVGATVNPAAADATGARFVSAGDPFTATITVLDSEGSTTPNFGKETPAQAVDLLPTLIAPTGGTTQNPAVSAAGSQVFNAGVATANFSWPEVGIIRLTPHMSASSYLGTGDVTGTTSGNVGRFYPKAFALTANTPMFQTACTPTAPYLGHTYIGQPLNFAVAPLITATAVATGGATTKNYTGSFSKVGAAPLTTRNYAPLGAFTVDQATPPAATIGTVNAGVFTIQLSTTSGMNITRTTPRVPFNAGITLSINAADTDGVTAAAPLVIGGASGIAFSGSAEQRYGRLAFRNAVGSELLPLNVPLRAEYYMSDAAGFVRNKDDMCSSAGTLTLASLGGNLQSNETCAINGTSCGASAPASQRLASPPVPLAGASPPDGGDFNLWLTAPGSGNEGAVSVTAGAPTWLQFDWDGATPGVVENPQGVATFGVYQGNRRRIYQRERVQ